MHVDLDQIMTGTGDPVARVELYHFAAPLPAPFCPAWIPGLPLTENRCTLLRVIATSGAEGWSAGPAMARERAGLGDLLGPYLVGEDATDLHLIQQRLREMNYLGWRNWWVEPAFWDMKAKLAGQPLYRLLGGEVREEVEVYASTGEVHDPETRIAEAEARYDEGFRTIKLRVHGDEAQDVEQVTRTARAVGDRMAIGVDANQGWRVAAVADAPLWDLDRARRFAEVCADSGVDWLEEPLAMDGYDDLAALTSDSDVPIAGGELQPGGYAELAMMVQRGCYDIFQPDALFTGGIAQTMRVIERVREAGLVYTPHTWTNGLGFAVNLQVHLASGFTDAKPLEYPLAAPGWVPAARDAMLTTPFIQDRGRVRVPTASGLGIEIDPDALKRHGKRFFVMDRKRLAWFGLRDRGLRVAREVDKAKRTRQRG